MREELFGELAKLGCELLGAHLHNVLWRLVKAKIADHLIDVRAWLERAELDQCLDLRVLS